ncbi:hypothetical protein [Pseudaeromonas paramecii]|uniref:Uncharacterized protein n=1 Tax=Pseudaeromonas paramecii TaxID=2138166 RepID=A0ABP8PY10_9GAMM
MNVYFSFAHEFSEDASEIVKICSMEYERFIMVAINEQICNEFISSLDCQLSNVSFFYFSGPKILGPIKNLMGVLCGDADYYLIDLENINSAAQKIEQLDCRCFSEINRLNMGVINSTLECLDPNLVFFIKKTVNELINFQEEVGRFLIGESYFSDSIIMAKINSSDFDNIKLSELNEFLNHLVNICGHYGTLSNYIDVAIQCFRYYMLCVPNNSAQLMHSVNSQYVQDSYPSLYKINSVINYLAYKTSMKKKLYNKAFMHLFRTYEYYTSGTLISRGKAMFGNANKKGMVHSDCYLVNNKHCLGFYTVYKELAQAAPNIANNNDYIKMDDYISMRNKFHYTHGDLKVRKDTVVGFESVVINQINFLEQELMQNRVTFQHLELELSKCLLIDEYESMVLVIKDYFLKTIKEMSMLNVNNV